MGNRRKALLGLALIALAIGLVYAFESLWVRQPKMLVYCKYYEAFLSKYNKYDIVQGIETNEWVRNPFNDHIYDIALNILVMNQIDQGLLKVTIENIPSYLSINISKVTIEVLTWYDYGGGSVGWNDPVVVKTLAENVPLGTEIPIVKSEVLRGASVPAQYGQNIIIIHIALSEYQISSSGGVPTVELTTTIELGVSSFT